MFDRFKGTDKTIIVGVQFANMAATDTQIASAKSIAKRLGMGVRLVHSVEGGPYGYMLDYPSGYLAARLVLGQEPDMLANAEATMAKLIAKQDDSTPIESCVRPGSAEAILLLEAANTNAPLIICGAKAESYKYLPKGFSTVLSLMSQSSVPVLVIPDGQRFDFSKPRLKILVADDLTESSLEATATASELAFGLSNCDLVHLHVYKQNRREMEDFAARIVEVMAYHDLEYDGFTPANIFNETAYQIRNQMEERLGAVKDLMASSSGIHYRQEIRYGDVLEQFTSAVQEIAPDLIVLGRHRFLHKKPFGIGKMPFHAMLNLSKPVLVVSSRD